MKTRPKAIGTRGETAAVRWLQESGWSDAERQPLRGTRDTGDLVVCRKPLIVADRMVCEPCAASVRSTFALAATLGISGVDLLMAVCDD